MSSCTITKTTSPRVLVLDVSLPGWAAVKSVLCEALGNVLCLGAATAQPGERLSVYTVRERHQCVLPLQEVRGNLCRLQRCLSELRALPMEGSGALRIRSLSMAVLDSLQQNKQQMQHGSSGATLHGCFVEVTIVSPRPGRELISDLDLGLKDADLSTLHRLLILHISCELENGFPETPPDPGSHVYDIDIHVTLPNVLSLEIIFKSWLLDHKGEKEKCHLKFPEGASEFLRAVSSPGVCGSMFYGLPTILTPTACWELDWDQLETNQDNFHALCHCLQSQQLSLVACSPQHGSSWAPPVFLHFLVSVSDSAALLLRQLAARELVLLMNVPPLPPTMAEPALHRIQDALRSLEADAVYNPLQMNSNLYRHLQVTLTQPQNPPRRISAGPSRQLLFLKRLQPFVMLFVSQRWINEK
ncbi:meiosis 1 arrest protein [Bufo bufo]|uniref:meiosis 1 arrest protein n=1 Tax=Bufo bufo TaxID=8384 RepID=UPI001ABE7B67|nr:meiosis 1 arrest protein [Bufo bufo]